MGTSIVLAVEFKLAVGVGRSGYGRVEKGMIRVMAVSEALKP
jgi:hypothetical protein